MARRVQGMLLALGLGLTLASAASAQQRRTIAIMPTQYFSASAESAENVTRGLAEQFERQGYTVLPMDRSMAAFNELGYSLTTDIGDPQIMRFARRMNADLVAHPQLMAVGLPLSRAASSTDPFPPQAVLYLRVLNGRTGRALYTRQIGYEFTVDSPVGAPFALPQTVATAAASEVTQRYFERVAGSREEIGRPAGR